jgi:putative ATP-grasp target RiPP
MATLAPPTFPRAASAPGRTVGTVRPFGLSKAVPVVSEPLAGLPVLSLCPERQINVMGDGTPFIYAPSMKSAFTTTAQTTEDSQLDTESESDTD